MEAFVYAGAGDNDPSSQVARMPPEFVIMKPRATAVARRTCGEALLQFHVERAGAAPYVPVMEKKREAYWIDFELEPVVKFDV